MHEMGKVQEWQMRVLGLGERGTYVLMVAREKEGGRAAAEGTEREFWLLRIRLTDTQIWISEMEIELFCLFQLFQFLVKDGHWNWLSMYNYK